MVYAQIQNQLIENIIVLNDTSLLPFFSNDTDGNPYEYVLQIDQLYPRPGIGWIFDGIMFYSPTPQPGDPDYIDPGDEE